MSANHVIAAENAIETDALTVSYGSRPAVREVSFAARRGEIRLVIGHNGAGKTTLLRAMFGLIPIASGRVFYNGTAIERRPPSSNVAEGYAFVPQGHGVFPRLTVAENLQLGGLRCADTDQLKRRLEVVQSLFPILAERHGQKSGTMSGGQQQMLAIGIALMQEPTLLVLDEPSIGLSPKLVGEVMERIVDIRATLGITVLMVEQNIHASADIADSVMIMKTGRKVYDGGPDILKDHTRILENF